MWINAGLGVDKCKNRDTYPHTIPFIHILFFLFFEKLVYLVA
jgi:hypothetical protein